MRMRGWSLHVFIVDVGVLGVSVLLTQGSRAKGVIGEITSNPTNISV